MASWFATHKMVFSLDSFGAMHSLPMHPRTACLEGDDDALLDARLGHHRDTLAQHGGLHARALPHRHGVVQVAALYVGPLADAAPPADDRGDDLWHTLGLET